VAAEPPAATARPKYAVNIPQRQAEEIEGAQKLPKAATATLRAFFSVLCHVHHHIAAASIHVEDEIRSFERKTVEFT
jgi:hypothetical protein